MLTLTTLMLLALPAADKPVEADVVIRGATLYDGSGKPGQVGDLALKGDRIVAVGAFKVAGEPRVIDGKGLVAAPGFIDLHTHSDYPLQKAATRGNLNYLMQGVSTVVTGNCGSGPTDVAAYFKALESGGVGSNVIHQVPHNDVRRKVMGNANRLPTADELTKMEALVDQAMKDGAWGLSTGLIYNPGTYAKTDEIIALARVAARHGGFYASHIRDEGVGVLSAIDEALTIGREAKLPVHISHLKASGRRAWGKSADEIALIEKARQAGQEVTADQYPYLASSTSLAATLIPPRFREGSAKDFLARLDDPEQGRLIRKAIESAIDGREGGKTIRIARYAPKTAWQGKDLQAIAEAEKKTPVEIAVEIERNGGASVVNFGMSEEDVRLIMKQPWVATASDGGAQVPGDTVPHPRNYGTFPRKIGNYAIADKLIPVEQAVRSASGLPADILKLSDRGYLKPGYCADVVLFDPETYRDRATYDKPHAYATGVVYLWVNGKPALEKGKSTGALAGRALRHKGPGE
ncbi:MAG TPA: D-aminoacylase [Gemmataceae bacterium]|nr:D-aminoacylase [Gemmataceae bacterium]